MAYGDGAWTGTYEEWIEFTGQKDTEETKGWYECPDEERSTYIEEHPAWWKKY